MFTVVSVTSVLVDVVSQVQDIVDGVFAGRVAECVEEAERCVVLVRVRLGSFYELTEVTARVDSQSNLGSVVVDIWRRLGASNDASLVAITDVELVVVLSVGSQVACFHLDKDQPGLATGESIPTLTV